MGANGQDRGGDEAGKRRGRRCGRASGKASKRRQAGRGSEKSLDCMLELKIGEPSSLTIASERETRNSYSSILDSQVTRLLEASIW
jgi:hypothetical protein